jgi:hypothetical protein
MVDAECFGRVFFIQLGQRLIVKIIFTAHTSFSAVEIDRTADNLKSPY